MYMTRGKFGGMTARYQSVDLSSRIEGATPHKKEPRVNSVTRAL